MVKQKQYIEAATGGVLKSLAKFSGKHYLDWRYQTLFLIEMFAHKYECISEEVR